ncbi:MAG: DNA mismatch repair protein MutS [Planctomycetes bacterium RIFCSPHIGHO2_02_FULL_50_42]|nr:MAG: DNA mismatch repair protein MutS [Planctomycetes bacterium RIFCSPHIGHO2_02_FULL_50_42]OHB92422.1 MAG: DNA mismatch repair protein MutS [Planctomycetes bacterium RIFCSPHIGHO2_12_FULL_51_37]OHB96645.1 MAG: DNA mismatch repair protein MutS [Planctomycetes bacterium RIFCSPLOWO2_02_FULL_50_16]OHC02685.1 MAG: DNA mismatch repair protein MutS [Planctomycetes bacterium RIFCSPLOWO2_12_FULL_50_35]
MKDVADYTPMMRQYHSFKQRCKDSVLFFRMGDFYEMFYEDAKIASRVLGIALTSRAKGEKAVPMAGVPHHSASTYIQRLLKAGHKVAICEQVQDPKEAKGIVDRDITRIITPGTLTDENLLDDKVNNYLAGILPGRDMVGISWVELSTGKFEAEDVPRARLLDELHRLRPSECIIPEDTHDDILIRELGVSLGITVTRRPGWEFSRDSAYKALTEHFGTASLDGFGCEGLGPALGAGGAVVQYLKETQNNSLGHITKLERFRTQDTLLIDAATQRGLELIETVRTRQSEGSLLWVLDKTRTPMGARLLKEWILFPLISPEKIRLRQEGVSELYDNHALRELLRSLLKEVSDIERISTRISSGRSNARDLVYLKDSLEILPRLKETLSTAKSGILRFLHDGLETVEEVRVLVAAAFVDSPPQAIREGGMIREGYSPELDELRNIRRNGREWIANYQADEIRRTGITSLKVNYNKVFGYYIEVTNTHKDRIPGDYIRKQTLKNAERYITPELKDYESKVLTAEERSKELEYQLFERIRSQVAAFTPRLQMTGGKVAQLDVLLCLAQVAAENNYVCPEITEGAELRVSDGRHPVLEKTLGKGNFVPNNTDMDDKSTRVMIITGPNMAGKSTYIRQVALLVLMAQMGGFIPAREARVGVADRIFTRIGASDELHRGQSTFMVEMQEAANILNNATARSLIILDEIGRGTSTFDGLSIAWAMTEYVFKNTGARTLFATHYHELTGLADLFQGIKNYNVAVKEWGDEVIFLRKIVEGGSDKSYGIHVARLAGIPREVITRARLVLEQLEANSLDVYQRPKLGQPQAATGQNVQLSLFIPPEQAIIEDLRSMDITNLTPVEALNKLDELKGRLAKSEGLDVKSSG